LSRPSLLHPGGIKTYFAVSENETKARHRTLGWREAPAQREKKRTAGLQRVINSRFTSPLATG